SVNLRSSLARLWVHSDRPAVRAFFLSMAALTLALVLALYSGAAAEMGHTALAGATAIAALVLAAWVAITLVPVLARRTPLRGLVELENEKIYLPSFSLRVESAADKERAQGAVLETPVYFPYVPKRGRAKQIVPLQFPRRGIYQQEAFRIVTRFPFGFLQKA